MSTPPASTRSPEQRPDERRRSSDRDPDRRENAPAQAEGTRALPEASPGHPGEEQQSPSPQAIGAPRPDRAVDADLLIDVPQLTVEQLVLELDASLLLNGVKLDAKGLEAGLYLKANLDLLRVLVEKQSGGAEAAANVSYPQQGSGAARVPTALRELLAQTRDAYRDLSDRNVQQRLRDVHASAREAYEQVATSDQPAPEPQRLGGEDGHSHASFDRVRHAAREGVKAAGMTAAGLAGGAFLESRMKPSRRLPMPRRRSRAEAIGHEIAKRLP